MNLKKYILVFFLIIVLAGCQEEEKETGLIFAHEGHADEISHIKAYKKCDSCHQLSTDKRHYSTPSHIGESGCGTAGCHDVAEELSLVDPSEDCLECHTSEDGTIVKIEPRFQDIIFSHDEHKAFPNGKELRCTTCHNKIKKEEDFENVTKSVHSQLISMKTCMDCHQDNDISNQCDVCHARLQPELRPDFHTANWVYTHGKVLKRFGSIENCQYCHDSPSSPAGDICTECHLNMEPKSHTLRWNKSAHGRAASHDRQRCATCHQADFCSDCHSETPATHFSPNFFTGGHSFLARRNTRSCFTCHDFEIACIDCHRR